MRSTYNAIDYYYYPVVTRKKKFVIMKYGFRAEGVVVGYSQHTG